MITVYKKKNNLWIEAASKNGHAGLEKNDDGYFHENYAPFLSNKHPSQPTLYS